MRTALPSLITASLLLAASCSPCGEERWAVKTLTDPDAPRVTLDPVDTTVEAMRALPAPGALPENSRLGPTELTTFRIKASLLGSKHETDGDYHLVIAMPGDDTRTMIVELADPECSTTRSSRVLDQIRRARSAFEARFGKPSTNFSTPRSPTTVTVTGVGFFDFLHGQRGVAPNGVELHPVLRLDFD